MAAATDSWHPIKGDGAGEPHARGTHSTGGSTAQQAAARIAIATTAASTRPTDPTR